MERLYVEQRQSTKEISLLLGCHPCTLLSRLKEAGIQVRSRSGRPRTRPIISRNKRCCQECGGEIIGRLPQSLFCEECARNRQHRPMNRIGKSLSSCIRVALKGQKNGRPWESLVGYDVHTLIRVLESKFQEGMTWENYGQWHIDHKIPRSWFYYETSDDWQFKVCWSLANLKPMWRFENISKGNKYAG